MFRVFFSGWLNCALIEEQHFLQAERLRLTQTPHWGAPQICFSFSFSGKKTLILTGNVSGRFKLISVSSSDDFIQSGVEEREPCHQRDSSRRSHPETCSWFVGYRTEACSMWKSSSFQSRCLPLQELRKQWEWVVTAQTSLVFHQKDRSNISFTVLDGVLARKFSSAWSFVQPGPGQCFHHRGSRLHAAPQLSPYHK